MHAFNFVESYFDAWNDHDPKAIADHLSSDGIYRDVPENARRSPDELVINLRNFFAQYRHRYELVGGIQEGQDTIAFQYRMIPYKSGHNGADRMQCTGAEFVMLKGDSALTITDYYDTPLTAPENKYAKSGLTQQQLHQHKQRLEHIMCSQRAFLKPDLTLPGLAEEVGCSVNHLSQVINSGFGTSFFDYLNRHRVDHARLMLTSLDSQVNAILNIAFAVGFNSNSAFYAAFKKFVGQTPAQFRRTHLEKNGF